MQKHVEILSEGLVLRGYFHLPETGRDKYPLVIMFHGFTGNKLEAGFNFVKISRELEKIGIASLRFDFGNSGDSDGEFKNMTINGEILDALNIIEFGKTLSNIDKNNISLLGFSMGGMIASVIAGRKKEEIRSLCLISPASNIKEILQNYFTEKEEYAEVDWHLLSRKALEDMNKIDVYKEASAFDKKVLLVHGTKDICVPSSLSSTYKLFYGENATMHLVEGADHCYSKVKWVNELLGHVINFFKYE